MGLAVAARRSVPTNTIRFDAVEEMAPALTEPLSQSKLSSSAASGASPRTSSSTTTTATVTATLGGTTLLPLADETLSIEQQQQQQTVEEVVDQQLEDVQPQQGQHSSEATVEGIVETGVAVAPTVPSSSSAYVAGTLQEEGQAAPLDGMGMSLPVTSGDGGSTTVDDIQNNNSAAGGGQVLLKQLDQDGSRDLVEIALEQLHHEAAIVGEDGEGGGGGGGVDTSVGGASVMMDAIVGAGLVDMGTVAAPVGGVPENVLQPAGGQQHSDFVLMDINNTPVVLPQSTFQEQQQQTPLHAPPMIGSMGQQHQDLSQSSTSSSSLGGVGGVGGVGGTELGGLMKESADMDQMLRELSTSDIDLLQVLKSFDNNSLLLFSDVDVGDANLCDVVGPVDGRDGAPGHHPSTSSPSSSPSKDRERLELQAEIVKRQAQMQRKYDFLQRRVQKVIARYMGQHVSEEVAGLFEHSQRYWKKREKEHAKQLHTSTSSSSAGGNNTTATTTTTTGLLSGSATEKWPDIIPFQAPPVDTNTPATPEKLKPISPNGLKTFAKRLEGISTTIRSVHSKAILHNRYFHGVNNGASGVPSSSTSHFFGGAGGADQSAAAAAAAASVTAGSGGAGSSGVRADGYANISNTIPLFDRMATQELEQTAGLLHAELRHVQNSIDSDATLSSSGGESADESMPYVNALQEPLTIAERASWKWSKDRSAIACRWTWLVARIADLEYRIRQHSEVLNKIRAKKGPVVFEEPPSGGHPEEDPQQQQPPQSINGYRGQLPGSSKTSDATAAAAATTVVATDEEEDATASCSRARPYCRLRFRKRKLLPTHNLHVISKRAARPSNFKCGCQWPLHPCALCTGRQDPTAPRDPPDTMPFAERIALLDPCYHSVLSFPEDISHSIHLEAIMRLPEWQNKMIRSTPLPAVPAVGGVVSSSSSTHKTSTRSAYRGEPNSSSFFSSGDETAPSAHGKRYTGSDGKRKYPGSSSNKYKSNNNDRSITIDSGTNKSKKAKSRRDVILQNNRKAGPGYLADGSRMAGPNGHSRNHKNKSRKSSHCFDYYDDGGVSRSKNSSPTPNQRNERRPRNSYDIDNIVIPYSMAAATRVSLPQYKDIAIPKWRVVDDHDESGAALPADVEATKLDPAMDASQCSTSSSTVSASASERPDDDKEPLLKPTRESSIPPNGTRTTVKAAAAIGASASGYANKDDSLVGTQGADYHLQQQLFVMPALDEEDISDEAIMLKHERALQEERKKFRTYMKFPWSRPRANRRTESRAGSSGGNTPDPTSPAPPTPMVEHDSSPACPSTPLTPQDGQELSEANVINALNKSLTKKERRRTVSSKREEQNQAAGGGVGGGTTTPDTREVVSPYESLQFPLADDIFEHMVRSMPNDHIAMVEDCISKLTGADGLPLRRSHQRNNNVLLMLKSSGGLAPASLGLGRNRLGSSASCSSTTLSANETDQEEFDDEDLMLAKRTEHQIIMERLLNSRGESQQYEIVPPTAKPMLGDDDEDAIDDEETDTGESLFVEEDDPNDPEWHDRPVGGGGGGARSSGGGLLGPGGRI